MVAGLSTQIRVQVIIDIKERSRKGYITFPSQITNLAEKLDHGLRENYSHSGDYKRKFHINL